MDTIAAAGLGVALILILLVLRWKVRTMKMVVHSRPESIGDADILSGCRSSQLVHRLCPHNNVIQSFDVEQKDSLDDHLDILARKLADKESRLRLSKSKIRETQNEIQNLQAIDQSVRLRYREIMDSLRNDLSSNEKECRKLQEQIEWVSRRRAELKEEASLAIDFESLHRIPEYGALTFCDQANKKQKEASRSPQKHVELLGGTVRRGHRLYGEAAAELASNLAELQKMGPDRVTEKIVPTSPYQRHRKEPHLPSAPVAPLVIKSSPPEVIPLGSGQLGYHTPM
ncbi:uncharacterized protein LOC125238476 isoform X1 [Leguminivora glycinivorella]|uniref:uncharacterized protein LOC125238476 isoform X1 n=1 Tax=Leguminivora glycinivorella TaxID=1035111 RepID=UPI00200C2A1A|nr:uncharacterized protein LOC125238476 isoform X1 [Leguminivora glycinivorella]